MGWAAADAALKEQAKAEKAVAAAAPAPAPKPAPLPPYIKQCVTYGLALQKQEKGKLEKAAAPKTADDLILAELKTADERRACSKAVLEYYQSLQKASAKKEAKTS